LIDLLGLRITRADIAAGIDLNRECWRQFLQIAKGLWQVYKDCDATLAEINPLVVTTGQKLLALDGKMVIDDNALFRQQPLAEMRDLDIEAPSEIEARRYGLSFIKLDGNIGCMVNGAGLAMTTMDIINYSGALLLISWTSVVVPAQIKSRPRCGYPDRSECQSRFIQYLWRYYSV
jgi:succinyl-CoA synthetase beta subunit